MNPSFRSFAPAEAGAILGVSVKALRHYEKRGLLAPGRNRAGWRVYDPETMARAAEIVLLRGLGLDLAQIASVLDGDPNALDAGLAAHEARLHQQGRQAALALERVRSLRTDRAQYGPSVPATSAPARPESAAEAIGFALPWPWGGEWFALGGMSPITFITGPLGSGKTRLAATLAAALPDAVFLGLDRLSDTASAQRVAEDALLAERVETLIGQLVADGATRSHALTAFVVALETERSAALVVEMVEDGLNSGTQAALMAHLRRRTSDRPALFLMTRSSVILDLDALLPAEVVILCPANHSPPLRVVPFPGSPGYEAVATCVAPPEVRARVALRSC